MKLLMKLCILIFTFVACLLAANAATPEEVTASLSQFIQAHYGSVESSPIPTGILYDLTLPLSGISSFNGSDTARTASLRDWLQIAHELKRASIQESILPAHTVFRDLGRQANREHIYSLAFLNFRFNRLRPGVSLDSALRFDGNAITRVDKHAFTEDQVFAVSALHTETYRGAAVTFRLEKSLFFSNSASKVRRLEIDFDDGSGFRPAPLQGKVVANYMTTGMKTIRVRATQTDGIVLHGSFEFNVHTLDSPSPTDSLALTATIPYNGAAATGEAYIYLADGHATLTRPAVVSEGFDIANNMNWDELYSLLNQQGLIETLRALGYDAVVLNYTDATTYIERNAMLVETLLEWVNQTIGPDHSFTLVGPSMGGLTTRYALDYMEANNIPHHVRTLIAFDTPNRGANIPLGLQYWVDFFASQSSDAAFFRDALNSPAAREMLITHFTSPPSNVAGSDPLRATLLNDFSLLGNYPSLPRLVAVANGSATGMNNGFNPGDQLILWHYSSFLVDITGDVWALNNTQSQQIFNGIINRIWPLPDDHTSVTVQPTWPWDNAPGGYRNSMQQIDSVPAPYGDIIALHPNHCFIPTISSLDLNVQDPFFDIAGAPDLYALTPFDSLYFQSVNQDHVEITPQSVEWFINEICDSLPAPVVVISSDSNLVRLNWTRVPGAQSYRIYSTEDMTNWPATFTATPDTVWVEPDTSPVRKIYRVEASTLPPAFRAGAETAVLPR